MNRISYSQPVTKQDRWVLDRFAEFGNAGRYYVEIGAHDGVHHSNTKLMEEEYGWSGLLVEPNPELFKQLKQNRTSLSNDFCDSAISEATMEHQPFWMGGSYGGLVAHMPNDFCEEHQNRATPQGRVQCIRLRELLSEYRCPQFIDYLSLDVEGAELPILESYFGLGTTSLMRHSFGVITVEFRYDKCLLDRLQVLLQDEYELEHVEAFDAFFVNRNLARLASVRLRIARAA